ncbi:hypothetical protein MMC14_002336 [Varicellaria rhodocarpa]|nr:hypothetical protein [Varicellaria rhodocarpa]
MPKSWLPIRSSSHFSLANIPFGIISTEKNASPRTAIAIGDHALDLALFASKDGFSKLPIIQDGLSIFSQSTLNSFASLGRPVHREVRKYLQSIFDENTAFPDVLKNNTSLQTAALIPLTEIQLHLPVHVGHYTDFFVGYNHAYNAGVLFRGSSNALHPNYTHLPVAYNGRASSVVVSGTSIKRPWGQYLDHSTANPKIPILAPSKRLDMELELGAFLCRSNKLGSPIKIEDAEESIFGFVLLNDWSARDIQAWESVPLGPFNGKSSGTSISPWVVLTDALEPFMCQGLTNETPLLPYLKDPREKNVYNINLEVDITSMSKSLSVGMEFNRAAANSGTTTTITRTNSKNLIFSFSQMLAHHTITGCAMQVGDLLGSGTVSGTEPGTQGCFLEQCENGKNPLKLKNGEERTFLEDNDQVTLRGWAGSMETGLVGFGECKGSIESAIEL